MSSDGTKKTSDMLDDGDCATNSTKSSEASSKGEVRKSIRSKKPKQIFTPEEILKRKKKLRKNTAPDRAFDTLPDGKPFCCDLCKSPYIINQNSKRALKDKRSRHVPDPKRKVDPWTRKIWLLCNSCATTFDGVLRPKKTGQPVVSAEEKAVYLEKVKVEAKALSEKHQIPEAERFYCSLYARKKCRCIQKYFSDVDEETTKKRMREFIDLYNEAKSLSQQKSYISMPVQNTSGKRTKKIKNLIPIGLGNGHKRSKAFTTFVLEKRLYLKNEVGLCERGSQRVLLYSNNFLHKKLKTEQRECRVKPLKGKAKLGLLETFDDMPKKRCCVDNCVMMALTHRKLLQQWRERASNSQTDARRVIAEMLTPSAGVRCNCYNFITRVSGSSRSTIVQVNHQMLKTGGEREPPHHGLKKFWAGCKKDNRKKSSSNEQEQTKCRTETVTSEQEVTSSSPSISLVPNPVNLDITQQQQLLQLQQQMFDQQLQLQQHHTLQQQLLQHSMLQQVGGSDNTTQNLSLIQKIEQLNVQIHQTQTQLQQSLQHLHNMTYSVQQNLLQSQISLGSQQVVQQLPSGSNLAIQQLPTRLQLAVQQFPTGSQPAVQQLQTRLQLAVQQLPTGSQPAVQQFPTGSQPAVQQFTTASQPAVQQLPTVSQLAVQQLPSGSQSAVQQFQTGSQPALQQLPTGSQPAVQQFQTGSQPAVQQFPTGSQLAVQQLPTVSQLAVQQFQTGSQPALQQFPPGSQLAVQQLPTVSQLAIQQLPTSSQLSFPQAASGSQINMQDVATGMQIALPQANIDSQLLLPQTATGSQMALSQGSVGQQIAMPQGSMVSQIVLPQVSAGSQLALPQDNIGQHIALSHTASDSQLNISQGNIVPQIILPQDNISSQLPLQQVTTSKQNTTPTKIQVTQLNSSQLTYMPPVAIASMPQVIDGPNLPIQSLESQITIQNSSDGSQMTLNSSQDKTKSSQDLSQKGPYQKGITSTSQSQPSGVVLQPFTLARNVLENQHSGGEDLQIMSTDQHSNNVSADQTDKSITVPWNQTVLESQQSNVSKLQNSPHHQQQISPAARSEILENVSNSTQQINTIFGKKNQQISSSVLNISGKLPQNENIGHKTMLEAQSIDKQMSSTVDSLQFRSKMFSGIQGSQTNCSSTNTVSVLGMNQRPIPSHVTSQQQVNQNFSSQVNSQQPVNQSFSSQINSQQPVNQSFSSQVNSQQPVNQNFSSQVNLQQPVNQSFSSHATSQQPVNKSFSSQVNVQQPVNQSFTSQVNSQQLVNQSFSSHATSQQLVNQSLSSAAAIQLPVNRSMFNYTTSQQQGVSIHASDQQPITPTPSASVRQQMNGQKSSLHGNILNKDLSNQITPVSYVSNQNTFSSSLSNPDVANLASQMNQSTFTQTEHTRTLQKSTETSQLNKFNNNNMDTSESLLHPKVQNTSDVLLRTHDKILPSVNVNVLNYLSQEQKSFKASANSAFQVRNANNQTLQSKKPIQTLKSDHLKEQTRDGIKEQGQGQTNTTGSNQNHSEVQDDSVNQNQNRQYLQQNMSLSLNNNAAFQILNQMQKGSVVTHEQVNNEGHNTNKHVLNNDKVVVPVRFVETLNNGSALDPTQIASRVQNSQLNTTKVNTETSQNVTLEYCHPPLSKLLSTSNGNHHKEHDQQNTTYVTKVGQKNKENKSQVVPGLTHMTKIVEQQSSKVITHMTKIVEQQSSKVMDSSSGVNPVAQILNVKSQNGGTVSVSRCGQIQEHSSSPESGIVADKQNTSNILVENENNTSSVTLNRNNTQMNTQQDYSHQKYINCSPSISNQQPVRTSQLKITQPTILNSTGDSIVRQIPQQHVVMQSSNILAPSSDIVNQQPSVPIQTQMVAPTQIVLTPTGDSVSGQQRLLQLNIQLQTNSPQEVANILQLLQNSDLTSQLPLSTSHAAVNFSPVPPTQSGNQRVPCVMESSATTMFTSTLGETSKVMIQPMIEPSSTAISSETSISVPKQVSMAIINKSAVQNINDVSSVSTLGSVNMTTQTCNQTGHQVAKDISVTSLANPLVSTSLPAFLPNKYVSKEMFHHSQGSPFASVQQSKVSVYPMKVIDKVQVQDKNEECSTNIRSDQMQRINFNSKEHQQQNKLGNNEGCTPEVQQNKIGNNEGCTPEVQQNKIGNNEGCTPEIVSVNQRSKQTTRGQSKTRTQHQYNQSHVTQNQGQGYTVYRQVQGQNECQGQITKLGQGYTVQKQSLVDNIEGQNKDQSKIMQGSVYREDEVDNIQRHITNIQATKEAGPLQNPNIVQGIIQGQHIKNLLPVNCTLVLKHKSNDDFQSNEGS